MRRLAVLVALACLALPAVAQAAAPHAAVFGLRAVGNAKLGYFVYSIAPGAARTGSVIVSNVGNAPGTVRLYTADGTTGPTSGTVYKTDVRPTQTGSWVQLSSTSLSLAPGAHRTVSFTVRVPSGQKPGQWVGGIVAETSQKVARQKPGQKARVQIKIRDLTIIAVQVNVPGAAKVAFAIGGVTTGGARGFQKLFVHLASNGNTLVKPHGSVTVFDKSGKTVESLPFTLDTFLPQTAIDYPLLLKKALGPGSYQALIRLVTPAAAGVPSKTTVSRQSFTVSNSDVKQVFSSSSPTQAPPGGVVASSSNSVPTWAYAVVAAVVVVLLLVALWFLLRRRGRHAPVEAAAPSRPAAEVTAPPPPPTQFGGEPAPSEPQPVPEPPPPAGAAAQPECEHDWDVAYDRGRLGEDGVWRFPHRCRNCGLELSARDVADANAQTKS